MKTFTWLIAFLPLIFLSPAVLAATDGQQYKDWQVSCTKPPDQKDAKENCHIFQNLVVKEGNKRVLHIAIGYIQNRKEPTAIITLPLGISLPPGIALKVDENEAKQFVIEACFPAGCQAGFPIDNELLKQFRAGKTLQVIFSDLKRKLISVPVSLNGFSAGINAIADQKGK